MKKVYTQEEARQMHEFLQRIESLTLDGTIYNQFDIAKKNKALLKKLESQAGVLG